MLGQPPGDPEKSPLMCQAYLRGGVGGALKGKNTTEPTEPVLTEKSHVTEKVQIPVHRPSIPALLWVFDVYLSRSFFFSDAKSKNRVTKTRLTIPDL